MRQLYVDADMIIKAASLLAALGALGGAVISVYRQYETNRKQSEVINNMYQELDILCYSLRGALEGIVELGGDGPCKDALMHLNKHLNERAHRPEF